MKLAEEVLAVTERIAPLLAGRAPEVQGAVLADLLATWLAGHQGEGAADLREELIRLHIEAVRELIPVNEALMAEPEEDGRDHADAGHDAVDH